MKTNCKDDEKYSIGKIFKNKKNESFKIIEKLKNGKRKIKFEVTGFEKITSVAQILYGSVVDDTTYEKFGVGTIHKTNQGYDIIIIEKLKNRLRIVEFQDEFKYRIKAMTTNINNGEVGNPYHKTVAGVGYLGCVVVKNKKAYNSWVSMICRCYGEYIKKRTNVYDNVKVCEEWKCYVNFEKWYEENYPTFIKDEKLHLDKDLLQLKIKNKIYSPETCVFLPQKINSFLTRIYNKNYKINFKAHLNKKANKESWICYGTDFDSHKTINLGSFSTKEEGLMCVLDFKIIQIKKAINYLKNVGYSDVRIFKSLEDVIEDADYRSF